MAQPASDDIREIYITPARYIYKKEKNSSIWFLKNLYYEYNYTHKHTGSMDSQLEAWQWIKAISQILKEKGHWDKKNHKPTPHTENPKVWCGTCKTKTPVINCECSNCGAIIDAKNKLIETFQQSIRDNFMAESNRKAEYAQKLLGQGMAPDDVREKVKELDAPRDVTALPFAHLQPGTVEWKQFYRGNPAYQHAMDKYKWKYERGIDIDGPFI